MHFYWRWQLHNLHGNLGTLENNEYNHLGKKNKKSIIYLSYTRKLFFSSGEGLESLSDFSCCLVFQLQRFILTVLETIVMGRKSERESKVLQLSLKQGFFSVTVVSLFQGNCHFICEKGTAWRSLWWEYREQKNIGSNLLYPKLENIRFGWSYTLKLNSTRKIIIIYIIKWNSHIKFLNWHYMSLL